MGSSARSEECALGNFFQRLCRDWLDQFAGHLVLTPREEQIVNLVTEGLNNREIARELNLKENTVKNSLLRIYDKLGVFNRVELVLYALSHSQERSPEQDRMEQQFGTCAKVPSGSCRAAVQRSCDLPRHRHFSSLNVLELVGQRPHN